jgi:hypothetical protein
VGGADSIAKAHHLHDLGLCRYCYNIDLDKLADGASHVHSKNCFDLIETSKECRLCAYVSSALRNGDSRSLYKVLVSRDASPNQQVPLSITLTTTDLEVELWRFGGRVTIDISMHAGKPRFDPLDEAHTDRSSFMVKFTW